MQEDFEGIAHVAHQMKPIGHLEGLGSGLATGQRIGPSAVTDQDGDLGMGLQPLPQRFRSPPFEDRHRVPAFQVHEERRVRTAPAEGNLINPENLRGGPRHLCGTLVANACVWTRDIAQPARGPGRHLRATGMGEFQEHLAPAFCLAGIAA